MNLQFITQELKNPNIGIGFALKLNIGICTGIGSNFGIGTSLIFNAHALKGIRNNLSSFESQLRVDEIFGTRLIPN